MEVDLFEDSNRHLDVALKLMKISLENDPDRYRELSGILKNTSDMYIIYSFYTEIFITHVIYKFLRHWEQEWNEDTWVSEIEFYDCLTYTSSLENCPHNLNDYILAKIEHDYKHRYANYNTLLLRRMAEIVIKETNIKRQDDILDNLFPITRNAQNVNVTNRSNVNVTDTSNSNAANTKKEGCYIATACYGSYDSPEVIVLRVFRDDILMKSKSGKIFIKIYYKVSPILVRLTMNKKFVNDAIRQLLDRFVHYLIQNSRISKNKLHKI
jgi:hypothetical protein